eukprot:g3972.t1
MIVVVVLFIAVSASASFVEACTTLGAGPQATVDGSVLVTQSSDGDGNSDPRIVHVPARQHPVPSLRPVFANGNYPRYIGDRAAPYAPTAGEIPTKPVGYIPQVNFTYSYYEGDYGMLNEKGVSLGETSCSARITAGPRASPDAPGPMLAIEALSRIALERCDTARCAVELMGDLSERYGFFGVLGAQPLTTMPNEAGESLLVGDARELWIFHVLPDGSNSSIWAAQRVPDDHVTTVDNMFVIREIDLQDTSGKQFLWGRNMLSVAEARGWWSPQGSEPFDFTRIFSYGEYFNKYYSGRRMWRVFSLLKPSANFSATYDKPLFEEAAYPVSVVPDERVTALRFMQIHRDTFENTTYDLGTGLAAGPWNFPLRFNPERAYDGAIQGAWERPIGSFRTTYTVVNQVRGGGLDSIAWFAPHMSAGSAFVPLFSSSLSNDDFQLTSHVCGSPFTIRRSCAFWAHRYVVNIAFARWKDMHALIRGAQRDAEGAAQNLVGKVDEGTVDATQASLQHASALVDSWWSLADTIIETWADGFFRSSVDQNYPREWLRWVGYQDGPPPPVHNSA